VKITQSNAKVRKPNVLYQAMTNLITGKRPGNPSENTQDGADYQRLVSRAAECGAGESSGNRSE
jgi:predicted chitinase